MDTHIQLPAMSQRIEEKSLPVLPRDLGLQWRPLQIEDAPNLFELITLIEHADKAPYRTSLEETVDVFEGSWKNFDTDSIAGVNQLGQIVAYGVLEMPPGDESITRVLIDGGVHPDARQVGLGQALVDWLVARASNMLRESDSTKPGRIATYLQDNVPEQWALYEKRGFEARRYYKALERDLSLPFEDFELAPHLKLIPYGEHLDEAVRLANNDAFRDHWGSEPQTVEEWAQGRSMFVPEWSLVVVDETQGGGKEPLVVGYVLLEKYEQDWALAGHSSGYIRRLGVRRAYRGQRIGLALLSATMRKLQSVGIEYAELDVDTENPSGAFGLYSYLGFVESSSSRMLALDV